MLDSAFFLLAAVALYLLQRKLSSVLSHSLPPGPKLLPILGNILDMPVEHEYHTYAKWGVKYGDVVHVSALGKHFVILNSIEAANDLLDGRPAIYSDRPFVPMLHEPTLMDSNSSFVFKRYSPEWRRQRRLFTRHLSPAASRAFFEIQASSSHTLLRSILTSPEHFVSHLRHSAAEAILAIAYGYKIKLTNDPLVTIAECAVQSVAQGCLPTTYLVNIFPWLKYVPAWVPGAGFKTFAAKSRESEKRFREMSFEDTTQRMAAGEASPSFVANALTDGFLDDAALADIKDVAMTMYGAAADTTVSSMHCCILALVMDPKIQEHAQAELDAVLGPPTSATFRLPTFADRPHLPYIDAIVKESLRWIPVAPIGVPHTTTEPDTYRTWRIPKGTIVIANAWTMLRDEKTYQDPMNFRPDRFLGTNPAVHPGLRGCFGFGKRECPGRHLAEASLWIQIASLLAVFTFSPAKDKHGRDIDVSYARKPAVGLILHPPVFPCAITPRSKEAEMRINETKAQDVF